jgi:hypothetical protein
MIHRRKALAHAVILLLLFAGSALPQEAMLLTAIKYGDLDELAQAIKKGADLQTADEYGRPAIVLAAEAGNPDVVRTLLTHGAAVDSKNAQSVVLMPANHRIHKGRTALMVAALNGHGDIVQLLLAAGAAPLEVDSSGQTAIDLAESADFIDLARLIQSYSGSGAVELPCEFHGFGADSTLGEQELLLPVSLDRAKELLEDSMIAYGFILRKDDGEQIVGRRLFSHLAVNMETRNNHPGEKLLTRLVSVGPHETRFIANTKSPPVGRKNRQWTTAVLQHAKCLYDLLDAIELSPGPNPLKSGTITVTDGTPIRLRLRRHLFSRTAELGQSVEFQVAANVLVDGEIAIVKDTRAHGKATEAKAGRGFGRRSALSFAVDWVTAVDGSNIPLRNSGESVRGEKEGGRVAAAALTAGILGAWLERGDDVVMRAGSEYSAFVAGDHNIRLSDDP